MAVVLRIFQTVPGTVLDSDHDSSSDRDGAAWPFSEKICPVSDYGTVSVLSGADLCLHGIGASSGHGDLYLLRTGASILSGKEMDPVCDRCIDRGIIP